MRNARIRLGSVALTGVLALTAMVSSSAFAVTNLVQNGGFESNPASLGQVTTSNLPSWSVVGSNPSYPAGYAWIFQYSTGSNGTFGLYNSTTTPGSTGAIAPPPGGGGSEFYGVDAVFHPSILTQTITGLTTGKEYAVSFDFAVAQQIGFSGPVELNFAVSLGGQTDTTNNVSIASHLFSGWQVETLDFTATGPSETLKFVADAICPPTIGCGDPGSSNGPPFALLDNVSVSSVPEPSTWAMMIIGFSSLALAGYRNRRKVAATA